LLDVLGIASNALPNFSQIDRGEDSLEMIALGLKMIDRTTEKAAVKLYWLPFSLKISIVTSIMEPFSTSTSIDIFLTVALSERNLKVGRTGGFASTFFGLSTSDLEGERLRVLSDSELELEDIRDTAASSSFLKTERTLGSRKGLTLWRE